MEMVPRRLHVQGAMGQAVREHASGFENWVITTHETDYMTAYAESVQDLVYLSGGALSLAHLCEHTLVQLSISATSVVRPAGQAAVHCKNEHW